MAAMGCKHTLSDSGIYIYKKGNDIVIIIVYIDDAIFMGNNCAQVHELKNKFMKTWECHNLGDTTEFLCMCILHKGGDLYLDQTDYLHKVLECFGMQNARATPTPLPKGYQPLPNTDRPNPEV